MKQKKSIKDGSQFFRQYALTATGECWKGKKELVGMTEYTVRLANDPAVHCI